MATRPGWNPTVDPGKHGSPHIPSIFLHQARRSFTLARPTPFISFLTTSNQVLLISLLFLYHPPPYTCISSPNLLFFFSSWPNHLNLILFRTPLCPSYPSNLFSSLKEVPHIHNAGRVNPCLAPHIHPKSPHEDSWKLEPGIQLDIIFSSQL